MIARKRDGLALGILHIDIRQRFRRGEEVQLAHAALRQSLKLRGIRQRGICSEGKGRV